MRRSLALLLVLASSAQAGQITINSLAGTFTPVCNSVLVQRYANAVVVSCRLPPVQSFKIFHEQCPNPALTQPSAGNYVLSC